MIPLFDRHCGEFTTDAEQDWMRGIKIVDSLSFASTSSKFTSQ